MPQPVVVGIDQWGQAASLSPDERDTHLHVIGASKKGKSKLLEHLITQDIEHCHGVCVLDPHGSLYQALVAWCAHHGLHRSRRRRIHLIDPNESGWTVGFDPLRCDDPELLSLVVDNAVNACAQVWGGEDVNRTPLLKKCLRAVFYALATNGRPLADAMSLISVNDTDGFRRALTSALHDEIFQVVWDDLNSLSNRDFAETFSSTQNRLFEFLSSPALRRMFRQKDAAIDLSACMENGDILLVNLQPKRISRDNARVVGTLLTNTLFNAALRRNEQRAKGRPFYLYIDECYRFLTSDVESMLDETRKFGLHVTLAHQRLWQLRAAGETIYNAVMGNAQTKLVFGMNNDEDSEVLARQVLRATFDFNRPKEILSKPSVVGYERIQVLARGRSEGVGRTEGTSSSFGDVSGTMAGTGISQVIGPDGEPLTEIYTGSQSTGLSTATSRATGAMSAQTTSVVVSENVGEALMPILQVLPTAVEGSDEIMNRAILAIRDMPPRMFIFAQPSQFPRPMKTVAIDDPLVSERRIAAFSESAREKSPFMMKRIEPVDDEPVIEDLGVDPFSVPEG